MDNIVNSILETINKKAASATLATYLFFWVSFHWEGFYVTFFTEQDLIWEKFHLLKSEYVGMYFFGWHGLTDWEFYLGFMLPAMLTYIFIWWIPKLILVRAYKEEQWYKVEKRKIRIQEESRLQVKEKNLGLQTEKRIEQDIKVATKRKEAEKTDPKIIWDEEYRVLGPTNMRYLRDILRTIYQYKGNVANYNFPLDPNALRFGDSNGIVVIGNTGERITLSEKGRYFANKFDLKI